MLTKTRNRTWIFLIVTFLISVGLMLGHSQGALTQMAYVEKENLFFLAAGRHGVVVARGPTPEQPQFQMVTVFDTPGSAHDVAAVARPEGGYWVYVADGRAGLRVLEFTGGSILREVGVVDRPYWAGRKGAERVAIMDGKAFLAYGDAGIQVVDITNPPQARDLGVQVDLKGGYAYNLYAESNRLFIAAGEPGLLVYNVVNPSDPALLGTHDPPQPVYDLAIVSGESAYLAEGTGGFALVSMSNISSPVEVAARRDIKTVKRVAVASSSQGVWIFAGAQGRGTEVLRFFPGRVRKFEVQSTVPSRYPVDLALSTDSSRLFVLDSSGGLLAYNISKPAHPLSIASYQFTPQGGSLSVWLLALGTSVALALFWVAFFAQFALPVRTVGDRFRAFTYLLSYIFGMHGPAIFIEDGIVRESRAESLRRGPGVILLDTASAAVLKTPGRFTRAVGPGVTFTRANERLAGVVDLHRQTQFIGPSGNASVLWERQPSESEDEYQERQAQRRETSGLTRDGIEVVPNIIAVFKLRTTPEDEARWHTRFGYNPESVWRAVVGEGVNLDEKVDALPEKRRMAWNWLPAYLAVDVWRDCLRRFALSELFERKFPSADDPEKMLTGMEVITTEVAARFRSEEVNVLDEFGFYKRDAEGKPVKRKSEEFRIVQNRGLQVYTIVITNIRLPKLVEEQLFTDWQKTWETQLTNLGGAVERERIQVADEARMNALTEYALWTCDTLFRQLQEGRQPDDPQTLDAMLMDLRAKISEELNLRRRMTNEWRDLEDLLDWLHVYFDMDGLLEEGS